MARTDAKEEATAPTPYAGPEHEPFDFGPRDGRPVLLLHGFPGTPAELRPLGEALARADVRAAGPLLPGFGRDIGSLSRQRWRDWLAAARSERDRLEGETGRPAVLLGLSMGGALAVLLAAERPPPALVLLAPFTRFASPLALALPVARRLVPVLHPFSKGSFADPKARQELARLAPGADLDDPAVRRRLVKDLVLPTSALDELRQLGRRAAGAAGRVRAPTLLVSGRDDETVLARDTAWLAERLGSARLETHVLPGGHNLARREEVPPLVLALLASA